MGRVPPQGGFSKSKHDIMGSHEKSDGRIGAGEPGKNPRLRNGSCALRIKRELNLDSKGKEKPKNDAHSAIDNPHRGCSDWLGDLGSISVSGDQLHRLNRTWHYDPVT